MKHLIYSIALTCLCFYTNIFSAQKAVIHVAIADLIGNPIGAIRPDDQAENAYNSIACCGVQTNSSFSCPRLHQLLYNDIVEVIKIHNDEVCIRTTHAFYVTPSSSTPQTHYWTLKKKYHPPR